jgi:hypothetical protein
MMEVKMSNVLLRLQIVMMVVSGVMVENGRSTGNETMCLSGIYVLLLSFYMMWAALKIRESEKE